jgi:hypothetical protein
MTADSESAGLSELAAEFPGFDFGTQRTWDGVSIIAIRQDGTERPGLCVVITADVDEMRLALLEGEGQHDGTLHGGVLHGGVLHGGVLHGGVLPEPRVGSLGEDRG